MPLSQPCIDSFRHVIFRDPPYRMGKPINLAPVDTDDAPPLTPEKSIFPEDAAFLRWIFHEANLDLSAYRQETLVRRIPACLRAIRASSKSHARVLLRRKPELLAPALNALVIGVTSFFRDAPVFDFLRTELLMSRMENDLRIWSIGCSDGAELYSVAMMLDEMKLLDRAHLLGTDCRPDAIARAEQGVYDDSIMRQMPASLVERNFDATSDGWRIRDALRSRVQWRADDVLKSSEPGSWDLILCRNLAIYLSQRATGALWKKLESNLQPSGLLVLGKAERPTGARYLTPVGPCVYQRARH